VSLADPPASSSWTEVADAALLKAMFEAADVMAGVFELLENDYRYVIANRNVCAFYGHQPGGLDGKTGRELGVNEPQIGERLRTLRKAWTSGKTITREYRFALEGGRSGWFLGTFSPIPGPEPRVSFVLVDVTARVEAELEAKRQQARLDLALSAGGLGLWEYDIAADAVRWDARTRELFGAPADGELDYAAYQRLLDPEESARMRPAYEAALRGENEGRYQVLHRARGRDGRERWIRGFGQALFGPSGEPTHVMGTVQDVSDEIAAQDRQAMMVAELNHRVKNNLATVQSMAAQTARRAGSLESFMADFEGRLVALARTHDVLTHNAWTGAELGVLLSRELSAFAGRVNLQGPVLDLSATQALAVALIVHELATNAAKYGALRTGQGRVDVDWRVEGDRLVLEWTERGGPEVVPPKATGFGSRLIRKLAKGDLEGEAVMDYAPEGLRFRLAAPLKPRP